MPRSLADGHIKFTILTEPPEDPENPTAAELNAGIHAEMNVLSEDFTFGATPSEKIAERPLGEANNVNAFGAGNNSLAFTVFRYWDAVTKAADAVADVVFDAVKAKGTELYAYARETAKDADEAWATGDEYYIGAAFATDVPQTPSNRGGYIKRRIETEIQRAWHNGTVKAA